MGRIRTLFVFTSLCFFTPTFSRGDNQPLCNAVGILIASEKLTRQVSDELMARGVIDPAGGLCGPTCVVNAVAIIRKALGLRALDSVSFLEAITRSKKSNGDLMKYSTLEDLEKILSRLKGRILPSDTELKTVGGKPSASERGKPPEKPSLKDFAPAKDANVGQTFIVGVRGVFPEVPGARPRLSHAVLLIPRPLPDGAPAANRTFYLVDPENPNEEIIVGLKEDSAGRLVLTSANWKRLTELLSPYYNVDALEVRGSLRIQVPLKK